MSQAFRRQSGPFRAGDRVQMTGPKGRLNTVTLEAGGEFHTATPDIRGAAAEGYVGADYSFRSSFFTTANDSLYSLVPDYGLLNLRAGVRAADGAWDLQVWGRNVGDEDYWLTLAAANTGAISGTLGDPRTYGVTLKVRR